MTTRRFFLSSAATAGTFGLLAGPVAAEDAPPSPNDKARDIIRDARKIVAPKGIEELRQVTLGGVPQWIAVRGRDRRNPILLFIHGGPGAPEMPVSWLYQSPWEDFFTVVQWDQRMAGKSVTGTDQAAILKTIGIERMTADGEDLVAHLREQYGKRKIFVLGHSWGTVIGLNLARRRPDWLHAYIGMGQMIYWPDNERVGYEFALREARADNNAEAIRALEAIAPYPTAEGVVTFDQVIVQRTWVIHYGGLTAGRRDFDYDLNARRIAPEYTDQDLKESSNNGVNLVKLLPDLLKLDFRPVTRLDCPVLLFCGRRDYQTPSQVSAAWLKTVKAPKKAIVWFEHSAHMMHIEQPGRMLMHLVDDVRPLAGDDVAPDDRPGV
ncbi:MAG: alpha/beta hydrolase [Caulobacteraceae bacterium]|nr:MAG: alpha/beta hydrolase [Caulobacteraceae bacterium]